MSRTEIDGDQVQDETLTGSDVLDKSLNVEDINRDFYAYVETSSQNISGNQFTTCTTTDFTVSASSPNQYRLYIDFIWGHSSAANDCRFIMELDGNQVGPEIRIEPKDSGGDQRIQNNILIYADNLSVGVHTLELLARPSSSSKTTRFYHAVTEVWRTK